MDRDRSDTVDRRAVLASGFGIVSLLGWNGSGRVLTGESMTDAKPESETETEPDGSGRTDPDPSTTGGAVFVNQVGYRPGDRKLAMVRADASSYVVVDAVSESIVQTGSLGAPRSSASAGDTVRWADFSDVTAPGQYRLVTADGTARSVAFSIGSGVWDQTLRDLCRQYTLRRSNTAIEDPITGLDIDPGHPQDREAALYFSDPFHDAGETIDVSGGWYDAGDYGKYVPSAAVTVAQLLLAYEFAPRVVSDIDMQFPAGHRGGDGSGDLPDLLDELRFELEWLGRMQRPDGAVYHKVAGAEWPGVVTPAADTQPRYVFGLSTFGTGLYAGVMAMAGRVYADFDQQFADRLVDNARSAFEYLRSEPDPLFREDAGQDAGSGAYRKGTDDEERFWAAAELLRTTGESVYADSLQSEHTQQLTSPPTPISWNDARLLGQWAYTRASTADTQVTQRLEERIVRTASDIADEIEADSYRIALQPSEYVWGSTKLAVAKGNLLLVANELDPRERFRQCALDQIHYALGRTPTGSSYVTGAGERSPDEIHCRLTNSTEVQIPGQVVGGPNQNAQDPVLARLIQSSDPAPARSYVDTEKSYASNEPAIDYAAPLIFAIATVSNA